MWREQRTVVTELALFGRLCRGRCRCGRRGWRSSCCSATSSPPARHNVAHIDPFELTLRLQASLHLLDLVRRCIGMDQGSCKLRLLSRIKHAHVYNSPAWQCSGMRK